MRDRHVYAMQERKREGERREKGREERERRERGGGERSTSFSHFNDFSIVAVLYTSS